jgi:Tfp pilus assembly protein PilZ
MENERRRYERINVRIPFKIRSVTGNGYDQDDFKCFIGNAVFADIQKPLRTINDPLLLEWLNYFDAKIDVLVKAVISGANRQSHMHLTYINLSAGGIGIETSMYDFVVHDKVEISLSLKIADKPVLFCLYGMVLWIKNITETKKRVGIIFINIEPEIQDKINEFVLGELMKNIA